MTTSKFTRYHCAKNIKRKRIQIRLPEQLAQQLQVICYQRQVTLNDLLTDYLQGLVA
jgi:hypothetical protein